MTRTYDQVEAAWDTITKWLCDHQDVAVLIDAIGTAQANAHLPNRTPEMGVTYCDHVWCTLDAVLADGDTETAADIAAVVETGRRAAGCEPNPVDQMTQTVGWVTEAIAFAADTPSRTVALRILAALICPTPEDHPAVLDAALAIVRDG